MPKITAFLARSFDPKDDSKMQQITAFLDSFRDVGFIWESAEAADVKSVSKKVQDLIDNSEAFVGVLTRREGIYDITQGWRTAWRLAFGHVTPSKWTAPPWVIQESGYAFKAKGGSNMILFVETGVELPGLQGDLEYIEFHADDLAPAFQKASEMIHRLLARAAGTVVETVVRSTAAPAETPEVSSTAKLEETLPKATSVALFFEKMTSSIAKQEWDSAQEAFEEGATFIQAEKPSISVLWQATYHRFRYEGGKAEALSDLKKLAADTPDDATPLSALGHALLHFQEYASAAEYFMKAARLPNNRDANYHLTAACRCLRKAKKYQESKTVLLEFYRKAKIDVANDLDVAQELHSLLKEMNNSFEAYAVAEYALHTNPGLGDFRFVTGLDYENANYNELALYHFKIICRDNPDDSMALNNLGVAYSQSELPIACVSNYKDAVSKGNTLAAANLAYRYLNGGFESEASTLIKKAIADGSTETNVPQCLAAIADRQTLETAKEKDLLELAEKHRNFLVSLGRSYLASASDYAGVWAFQFGQIRLSLADGLLTGSAEISSQESSGLSGLFGAAEAPSRKVKEFRFHGVVEGRTCQYRVDATTVPQKSTTNLLGALSGLGDLKSSQNGYIAFSEDGNSAEVCELKSGKLDLLYQISKTGS